MPTKRSQEIATAVGYLKSRNDLRKFVADDEWARTALEVMFGLVLDKVGEDRTQRSILMLLTGTEARQVVSTDNPAEARRFEAFIKAIESGMSAVYNQRKKYRGQQRERKREESSENPVTKKGQMRLI